MQKALVDYVKNSQGQVEASAWGHTEPKPADPFDTWISDAAGFAGREQTGGSVAQRVKRNAKAAEQAHVEAQEAQPATKKMKLNDWLDSLSPEQLEKLHSRAGLCIIAKRLGSPYYAQLGEKEDA